MKTIGITGGVGAGKTLVLHYLKERYGAYIIAADELAHELEAPGHECYDALVQAFGKEILQEDGCLDKKKFAGIIFGSEEALAKANGIIHPAVKKDIRRQMREHEVLGTPLFVVEAALLLEEHYGSILSELWYIHASEAVRGERLRRSRGYSDEKIRKIMAQQRSEEEFRKACKVVIDNGSTPEEMHRQVDMALSSCHPTGLSL